MADARTNSLKNLIFAQDATTTIPETPSAGTTYRDTTYNAAAARSGWPYYNVVNSANFNQVMFLMTSLLNDVEKQGILYWSAETDYIIGSICRDNANGRFYTAIQASGPSSTPKQPSSNSTYWSLVDFSNGASWLNSWMDPDGGNAVSLPVTGGTGVDFVQHMGYTGDSSTWKWYRKWKNGWLEQGGFVTGNGGQNTRTTITFPLTFADTNYIVFMGNFDVGTGGSVYRNKTTTTVDIAVRGDEHDYSRDQSWYAIGIAATI